MFDWQNWQLIFTQFHFIRPLWLLALFPAALLIYSQWEKTDNDNWQQSLPSHLKKSVNPARQWVAKSAATENTGPNIGPRHHYLRWPNMATRGIPLW